MIGALGNILAALGVIFSLIYLAVQIKDQNKERRHSAVSLLTSQWADLMSHLTASSDFGEIWLRGLLSFDDLDSQSKIRFGTFLGVFLKNTEGLYLHKIDGDLDQRIWRGMDRTLAELVTYPGVQSWWETRKQWHSDEFAELIDGYMAKDLAPTLYEKYL